MNSPIKLPPLPAPLREIAYMGGKPQDVYGIEELRAYAEQAVREALAAQSEWMPIETAPKDKSEVWAFNGEQARMQWSEGDGWALWVWCDPLLSDVDPSPDQPTYWMPLPAPPKENNHGDTP